MIVVMRDRSRSGIAVAGGRLHADERWEGDSVTTSWIEASIQGLVD